MTKKNIEFTETVSERTAIYVLSSRCCRKTKNLLKVSSGGLGRTVFQSLNSSGILSSSSRSGPLRLGDPLLQPWTCNTRWLCWDTDLWVNLTPSKKPTPPPPQSQLPSVLWLSGLLSVRVFNKFFINSGKLHFIYSICLAIEECGVIHRVLHKIACLLMLPRCVSKIKVIDVLERKCAFNAVLTVLLGKPWGFLSPCGYGIGQFSQLNLQC